MKHDMHNMHDMQNMPDMDKANQKVPMPEQAAHLHGKAGAAQSDEHMEMREQSHHAMMVADFRRRFWISLIITIPILMLSPLVQKYVGLEGKISFTGDSYVL
jgi:Cu2+-exporting ATPase